MVASMVSLKRGKVFVKETLFSPLLFVFCLEYFSRMVNEATKNSELNFHPKCAPLRIIYLTFTDDLMLYAKEDVISVDILINHLSSFGDMSRLKMNIDKSSLYIMGVHGKELEDILALANIPKGSMPFR